MFINKCCDISIETLQVYTEIAQIYTALFALLTLNRFLSQTVYNPLRVYSSFIMIRTSVM